VAGGCNRYKSAASFIGVAPTAVADRSSVRAEWVRGLGVSMQNDRGQHDHQSGASEEEEFLAWSGPAEAGGGEPTPGMASFEMPIPGQGHDHQGDVVPPDEASGGWEASERPAD
jgi:hypothetical protein